MPQNRFKWKSIFRDFLAPCSHDLTIDNSSVAPHRPNFIWHSLLQQIRDEKVPSNMLCNSSRWKAELYLKLDLIKKRLFSFFFF